MFEYEIVIVIWNGTLASESQLGWNLDLESLLVLYLIIGG
jgi:hypothetical protein